MTNQEEGHSEYLSYLLRLWHTQSAGHPVWRTSLEEPLTQEVVHFEDMQALFAFLLARTAQDTATRDRAMPPTLPAILDEGRMS